MEQQNSVAQTALYSSFFTLLIIGGLLFIFREPLATWLLSTSASNLSVAGTVEDRFLGDIPSVVAAANDAVVSIVVTKDVPIYERYFEEYNPFGGWFGGGFAVPRVRERGTEEREIGGGSGFIVSADGYVVTNRHVVADTDARYSILLNNGESYEVEILARDPVLDIAVLRIRDAADQNFPFLRFGDSDTLRLGEPVIAIGNALAEFRNSVSVGVISGLSRTIVASGRMGMREQLDEVIQTDAAINPGNSGGPLLNAQGEVIGVNVATSIGADNIGFALPAQVVEGVVRSVQETGEIVRPFLGIRYEMVNTRLQSTYDLPYNYGARIVTSRDDAIVPDSPAAAAGLRPGEVILEINAIPLREQSLASVLRRQSVGDTIELRVWGTDGERTVSATLIQAPQ